MSSSLQLYQLSYRAHTLWTCDVCGAKGLGDKLVMSDHLANEFPDLSSRHASSGYMPVGWSSWPADKHKCPRCTESRA